MTRPNFLVIGCKRAGSTLLHELLRRHDFIYVPTQRKELWFFDRNWSKGPKWYESFFPEPECAEDFSAIGEVTPGYIYGRDAPSRVRSFLGQPRLIVMARHPAAQAWSWWQHDRAKGFRGTFQDWLCADRLSDLATGSHLERWFEHHPRGNFLVLVFEEFLAQPREHLSRIASHLGAEDDWRQWQEIVGQKINRSVAPSRFGILARRLSRSIRQLGLNGLVNLGKRVAPQSAPSATPLPADLAVTLHERFKGEIAKIEAIIGRPVPGWRPHERSGT